MWLYEFPIAVFNQLIVDFKKTIYDNGIHDPILCQAHSPKYIDNIQN